MNCESNLPVGCVHSDIAKKKPVAFMNSLKASNKQQLVVEKSDASQEKSNKLRCKYFSLLLFMSQFGTKAILSGRERFHLSGSRVKL